MKYIGSKAKIANDIVPIIQRYIDEHNIKQYIEPFVGGFNIIDKIKCEYRPATILTRLYANLSKRCATTPHCSTRYIHRPVRNITTCATTRANIKRGTARQSCFLRLIMPAFTVVVMGRRQIRKTAARATTLPKAKQTLNVNSRTCDTSWLVVAIIDFYVFRATSAY